MTRPARFFPLLALLASAWAGAHAQVSWWESDALGMAYRPASAILVPGLEWALKVERAPGAETRVLYREGKEHSRIELRMDGAGAVVSERETKADGSTVETGYRSPGRVATRTERSADGEVRVSAFEWSGSLLVSVIVSDASGTALWKDSYRYSAAGEPAEFRRTAADGSVLVAGSAGATSWLQAAGLSASRAYDPKGRLVATVSVSAGGVPRKETSEYEGDSRVPARVRIEEGDAVTVRVFDASGLLVSEEVTRSGVPVSERTIARDASGRVSSETLRSAGRTYETTYAYRSDGSTLRLAERVDGVIVRAVDYEAGGRDWTESLYDRGVLFARLRWSEGKPVSEELWSGGALVRERSLP